jgi:hypothetical protein
MLAIDRIDVFPAITPRKHLAPVCYSVTPLGSFLDQREVDPRKFLFACLKQGCEEDALAGELTLACKDFQNVVKHGTGVHERQIMDVVHKRTDGKSRPAQSRRALLPGRRLCNASTLCQDALISASAVGSEIIVCSGC